MTRSIQTKILFFLSFLSFAACVPSHPKPTGSLEIKVPKAQKYRGARPAATPAELLNRSCGSAPIAEGLQVDFDFELSEFQVQWITRVLYLLGGLETWEVAMGHEQGMQKIFDDIDGIFNRSARADWSILLKKKWDAWRSSDEFSMEKDFHKLGKILKVSDNSRCKTRWAQIWLDSFFKSSGTGAKWVKDYDVWELEPHLNQVESVSEQTEIPEKISFDSTRMCRGLVVDWKLWELDEQKTFKNSIRELGRRLKTLDYDTVVLDLRAARGFYYPLVYSWISGFDRIRFGALENLNLKILIDAATVGAPEVLVASLQSRNDPHIQIVGEKSTAGFTRNRMRFRVNRGQVVKAFQFWGKTHISPSGIQVGEAGVAPDLIADSAQFLEHFIKERSGLCVSTLLDQPTR